MLERLLAVALALFAFTFAALVRASDAPAHHRFAICAQVGLHELALANPGSDVGTDDR